MSQHTAIIDIGSSKVICLICSVDASGATLVHGAGICEYSGYKRGVFEDENRLIEAVSDALAMAESEAKHRVRDISVGVPAPFIKLILNDGAMRPKASAERVSSADVEAVLNASAEFTVPDGYELMHSTPVHFMVDGTLRQDMPIGVRANNLSARVSHVLVDVRFKELVSGALGRVGLDADMYIGVPLSEALFVIPQQERMNAAVLLDVGATHTDVSLVHNNALLATRTIDVGGDHFTTDLAYGLQLQRSVCENIKRRYVYSLDYQDSIDTIRIPGGGAINIEHSAIQYILEARGRELAELILDAFEQMGIQGNAETPVYLSGGGISLMRGCCEFFERYMGVPIQVRMPWMPRLSSPNYASAYSVMEFVTRAREQEDGGRLLGLSGRGSLLKKLRNFFI